MGAPSPGLAPDRRDSATLLALFALGFSCVMTQLALMRELLAAFSGNEMVLGVVLGLWLLLMGTGAWVGGLSARLPHPAAILAFLLTGTAILPPAQIFLARALRNVVFVRGADVGVTETLGGAFVLLLPYCLAAGCALSLGCAILAREQGALGAGRGYVADSAGSLAGGLLFSLVLVRSWDHIAILLWPALLSLVAVAVLNRKLCLPAGGLALALLAAVVFLDPDGLSTRLQYRQQHLVERANSPYGKLLLAQSKGQLDFIENGVPLISTRDDQHLEETVHYALAQRPDARRVLLVSGGISGTAREILKYPVSRVDYVELDPLILELGQKHLPENLADPRIHLFNTDGRLFIKQEAAMLLKQARGARRIAGYDVIILDLPAPATAQLNRFYTVEFLAEAKQALAANGVVSFSLGRYENYVSRDLARLLASAERTVRTSFKNTLAIPGSRVFFLASDGPLFADIASRLEARQVRTRLVNRHYLDAMLAPDRMADLARAVAEPAAINRDFSPILYFYHLRHWMSQFNLRFGPLQAVAPAGAWLLLGALAPQRAGSVRLGFCSLGPGARPAPGLPGPVRLGLSPGRPHRDGLYARSGGGRLVDQPRSSPPIEPSAQGAAGAEAVPPGGCHCRLRPLSSADPARAWPSGRGGDGAIGNQNRHCRADLSTGGAGRHPVPVGQPDRGRRSRGPVAPLHR